MAIHKVQKGTAFEADTYVIASRGMWLPGSYDSERTARYAFRFSESALIIIRDKVNKEAGRPITFADLKTHISTASKR